jgi:hypothetical protein
MADKKDRDSDRFIWSSSKFNTWPDDKHKTRNVDYSETEVALNERISELDKKIDGLVKKTDKIKNDTSREIQESKNRVVETLALFAVLFTFLSAQVSIFKDAPRDKVVPLVFITSGLLIFFILTLDFMISSSTENSVRYTRAKFFILAIMTVGLLCAGYFIYPK